MKLREWSSRRGGTLYIKLVDVPNDANILPIYEGNGEVVLLLQSKYRFATKRHIACLKSIVAMMERTQGRGEFQGLAGAVSDGDGARVVGIKDSADFGEPD